ncbi:GNAT family N-acetyltransferase [Cytobacillus sp. FJAT-54145]|uniref:GNAT family N-acetyltransferase n=1 Tax=Cytobacillus spartinae TaxID=3299023 RepID=A0ABW6KDU9_9BACI
MKTTYAIRSMEDRDKEFIIGLSSRFNEFEFMGWREPAKMQESQVKIAKEAVENNDADSDIYVVEGEDGILLGYLHVCKTTDYFTGVVQGYISAIVVSKEGEGKGIAKGLMRKAEEWTKSKGYKQLVLNVFANNQRAVDFYTYLNYEKEIVKMVKEL